MQKLPPLEYMVRQHPIWLSEDLIEGALQALDDHTADPSGRYCVQCLALWSRFEPHPCTTRRVAATLVEEYLDEQADSLKSTEP